MEHDRFKETAWYGMLGDPMKVVTAMYFCDQDNDGLSFSDLKEILKGEVTPTSISRGLDIFFDQFEVEQKYAIRGDYLIQVYTLDSTFRDTLKDIHESIYSN